MSDFTVIRPGQLADLRRAMERIKALSDDAESGEYTDSGAAWEVLQQAHDAIEHVFTPVKQPAPATALPDWKRLALTGEQVVEDFMPNIGKCALQDYGRLNSFLNDMAAAKKASPKLHIEILWGENPELNETEPCTYEFDTQAELTAFRNGVESAQGWFDYDIIYTDEES